jgi:diguanylate cyclase (GGDEF)-like protein
MDSFMNPLFFIGIASGICTLLLGVWLGTRIGRNRERKSMPAMRERIQSLASQLASVTDHVNSDVRLYNGRISEFQHHFKDINKARQANMSVSASLQEEGQISELLEAILQVNEQMRQRLDETEARLEHQAVAMQSYLTEARTDSLTNLSNRRVLDQHLEQLYREMSRAKVADHSLILIDVDHFKRFNDQYGHQAGDEVLKEVTARFRAMAPDAICVARYGGEEFAILVKANLRIACELAERIRLAICSEPIVIDSRELSISASFGVAICESSEMPKVWIRHSDAALYSAKGAGRNIVVYYDGKGYFKFDQGEETTPSRSSVGIGQKAAIQHVSPSHVVSTEEPMPQEETICDEVKSMQLDSVKMRIRRRLDEIVREESTRR